MLSVNEPDLHVFEAGEGPPVVLLHGMPSPPDDLEALAPELAGRRVLVPHLPGYGQTPHAPGSQGIEAVEAALIEALALRHVEHPVIVGFSAGAYRALSLALAMGAAAVVCLGGFAELSDEEKAGARAFAATLRAGVDPRKQLPGRFLSASHRAARPIDDVVVERWIDSAARDALIEELEDLAAAPSLLPRLAGLDVYVTVRHGELDVATPRAHAERIVGAARAGRLQIVPGVGHALLLEDRPGTVAALRAAAGLAS